VTERRIASGGSIATAAEQRPIASTRISMKSVRRFARSSKSRPAPKSRSKRDFVRRALVAERLETRAMMAADWFASDFWNGSRPEDVNADKAVSPLDALLIINELNKTGSRPLMSQTLASTAGGEGESNDGGKVYYDVNNDGHISPIDSLLVINALNAEGEGELMKYQVYLVNVGAAFNSTPLTSVPKGTDFDLVVTVQDLRAGSQRGVSSGFLDILVSDQTKTSVFVNEIQHVILSGAPTGGSFTLSFNGQTTADIPLGGDPTTDIANDIKAKLEALSTVGAGNTIVTYDPVGGFDAWQVRFVNARGDQDLPAMTGDGDDLTGGSSPEVVINETADGVRTDPVAFREAFRALPAGAFFNNFYQGNLNAGNASDRIDDVGGVYLSPFAPFPGKTERVLVRARMNADDAGVVTFTPSIVPGQIVSPAHDTLLYDKNEALVPGEISFGTGAKSLTITELVSANPDIVTIGEDSGANSFNPIAGVPGGSPANGQDVKDPSNTGTPALRITAVNGQTSGTINLPSGATVTFSGSTASPSITYTPAANFVGQDVFSYTISDTVNFDTTTVTVNVTAANDAPHNFLNGADITGATPALSAAEDTPFVFNAANNSLLSVSDVDAGAATNNQVTLTVNNGTLTLSTTSGLTFNGGANGTGSMTFSGSLANINAALNGMVFNPNGNFAGNATLQIVSNDMGNTGAGGALSDTDNLTINVGAVNDAPVNTVPPAQDVDEFPDVLTFNNANGNRISVADVDAGAVNTFEVTLNVNNGKLKLSQLTGITVFSGQDNTASMGIRGTLAAINAALDGLTYTGGDNPPFIGTDTLTINSNDKGATGSGGEKFDQDTVTINVIATVRPRAVNDNLPHTEGGGAILLDVMDNDLPHQGFATTLLGVGTLAASRGTIERWDPETGATLDADLTDDVIRYTPPSPDFFGTVTFTYTINDTYVVGTDGPGPDADSTATVTLTIAGINDAPTAVDDPGFTTPEDTALTIPIGQSVLNNDLDPDNQFDVDGDNIIDVTDPLSAIIETNPANGTVTLNLNGTFTYTPNPNYNGPDSFTYRVRDSANVTSSNTATVSIDVIAVNDKPIGNPDTYSVAEDGTLTANGVLPNPNGILNNDTDGDPEPPDQPLTVDLASVTQPVDGTNTPRGTLVMDPSANGHFTYTPPSNFFGTVTFKYRASDGQAQNPLSDLTTVTINVTPVNDAPVVADDSYTTNEDTPLVANGSSPTRRSVLFNDTDVDSSGLGVHFPLIKEPDFGTLVINDNGTFTYTPDEDFFGTDTFQYRATDGFISSQTGGTLNDGIATVTITVVAVGDPPVANPDSYTTDEDIPLVVDDSGPTRRSVLFNDTDPDSPFTVLATSVTQPRDNTNTVRGTLVMDPSDNGRFTYTPPAHFSGVVTFQYRATDGGPTPSNLTTVTITINETNDPPDAVNDDYTAIKDFDNQVVNVLANDTFAPDVGETLKVVAVQGVAADVNGDTPPQPTAVLGGTVRLDNFVVLYDSPDDYEGPDSFTYTISDNRSVNPLTDTATVNVDVLAFIPKIVEGVVYVDADNNGQIFGGEAFTDANANGVYDAGEAFADSVGGPRDNNRYDAPEKRVQGVTVQLSGTDFQDNAVFFEATTDASGRYRFLGDASTQFLGIKPGTYTVTEIQPNFLSDGQETETHALASIVANDQFQVSWDPEDFTGDITGLNFGELGINTSSLADSSGMIQEILASSGPNGLVIATNLLGGSIWSWAMPGWNNLFQFELILDANLAHATLRVWDGANAGAANPAFEIRIHQDPNLNNGTDSPAAGSMARFRVLGRSANGEYIIRLDGTALDFGLNLLAAAPVVGEGEAEGEAVVDRDYAEAADAAFAEGEAWA
jgi:VCBS repeat-containing protein